jgi:hypothetical protein
LQFQISWSEHPDPFAGQLDGAADSKKGQIAGTASAYLTSKGWGWVLENAEDEDVGELLEELEIDVDAIKGKLRKVVMPWREGPQSLLEPDFGGPLAVVLSYAASIVYGQVSAVGWLLTVWCCGSGLVFFMLRWLGQGTPTAPYSAVLSVIGYAVLPLIPGAWIVGFLPDCGVAGMFRLLVQVFVVAWATAAASPIIPADVDVFTRRKYFVYYLVFLLNMQCMQIRHGV